jgi:hypothetical protein
MPHNLLEGIYIAPPKKRKRVLTAAAFLTVEAKLATAGHSRNRDPKKLRIPRRYFSRPKPESVRLTRLTKPPWAIRSNRERSLECSERLGEFVLTAPGARSPYAGSLRRNATSILWAKHRKSKHRTLSTDTLQPITTAFWFGQRSYFVWKLKRRTQFDASSRAEVNVTPYQLTGRVYR